MAATDERHNCLRTTHQAVRPAQGGGWAEFAGAGEYSIWLFGAERGREIDHHEIANRPDQADRRESLGGGIGRDREFAGSPAQYRLFERVAQLLYVDERSGTARIRG